MTTIETEILTYIRRNRISTTEIADCLGKQGALDGIYPLSSGMYHAGFVRYIYGHSESNWSIHEQARYIQSGEIIVIDGIEVANRALAGELVTKFVIYYKMAEAIVALGRMRDANDLIKNRFPVWCKGVTPVGCFNKYMDETEAIKQKVQERKNFFNGSLAVCDDTGVVVIPRDLLNESFLQKLIDIEQQEDIWFNCIDFKKWDTFDTVCKKKYLSEK